MSMTRRTWLGVLASVAAVTVAGTPAGAQQTQKPNVVFILADNVGYGDLGAYGGGELRGAPTPSIDQLAREGLRLTQFLVEPACTPSRAALMTGRYSIRSGLSLIAIEGSPNTLSAHAFTMGEMFKGAGYATAIFGKWHLGSEPQSLPTAHGFDEFYGIPPNLSWDAATYVDTMELTHSTPAPPNVLLALGPQIVQATAGGPLQTVKPFTPEVRANIDYELVDKPDTTSYAMFSIMDFLPTFSNIVGGKMPTDRPIDGVDQTDVLLGNSTMGHRESLLSFIGADLVAARWKQWRIYFTDVHPTGSGPQREPGIFSASASLAGYPKVYNIEMDPHEDLVVGGLFSWVSGPALKAVDEYLETVKKYPNPPAPNITQFKSGGG